MFRIRHVQIQICSESDMFRLEYVQNQTSSESDKFRIMHDQYLIGSATDIETAKSELNDIINIACPLTQVRFASPMSTTLVRNSSVVLMTPVKQSQMQRFQRFHLLV